MYVIEPNLKKIFNSLETVSIITIEKIAELEKSNSLSVKEVILRNFIGKSFSILNSIHLLLTNSQEGEATALLRLLNERFFFLAYVIETKSYKEFDDWSYIRYFEKRNKIRSSSIPQKKYEEILLRESKSNIDKYKYLKKTNSWVEPKIEKLAKKYKLKYLYSLGYDLYSSIIHVRSNEGYYDCLRLVEKKILVPERLNSIMVNAILFNWFIFRIAINDIDFSWTSYYDEYLTFMYDALENNSDVEKLSEIEMKLTLNLQQGL